MGIHSSFGKFLPDVDDKEVVGAKAALKVTR